MAWSEAVTAVGLVLKKVLDRLWGEQTRQGSALEDASAKALQRAQNAQSADELNAALSDLERLYHDAVARRHQREP